MDLGSRIAIVAWSALPGLIVGLLAGGGLWVVAQLGRHVIPRLDPVVQRWSAPLAVLCFVVLPVVALLAGALEGWLKQR